MNCPRCNTPLLEGARFCSKCGGRIAESTSDPAQTQTVAAPSSRPIPPPRTASPPPSEPAPIQPVPDWGLAFSQLWARIGSGPLLAAGVLGGLGLIFAIVGLQMTLSGHAFSSGELNGSTWQGLAAILVVVAVGWAAAARAYLRQHGVWAPSTDFLVAAATGALALLFGFVALGVSLSFDEFEGGSTLNAGAWATFAQVWAFLAFGWLALTRPIDFRTSQVLAGIGTGLALLFGIIGLATGLGGQLGDAVQGEGWHTMGLVCAVLAVGVVFGSARS